MKIILMNEGRIKYENKVYNPHFSFNSDFSLSLISCENQTNENIEERLNNLIIDIAEISDEIDELQNGNSELARRITELENESRNLSNTTEEATEIDKEETAIAEEENGTNKTESDKKTYQQIFTFNGTGIKQSESFIITGEKFKIRYDCSGDLNQAFLYKIDDDLFIELIVNTLEPIEDETVFYGSGEYYIEANMIGSFSMIVCDYK